MFYYNLYNLTGFLVDAGCKDIDDALHCTASPNGNFEVGVRILDILIFMFDTVDSTEMTECSLQ